LLGAAGVDDVGHAGDGHRGLGHVGRYDDLGKCACVCACVCRGGVFEGQGRSTQKRERGRVYGNGERISLFILRLVGALLKKKRVQNVLLLDSILAY
jgi:hypothetical protein